MNKKSENNVIQAWIQLHRAHRQLLERVEYALKSKALPPLDWYDVLLELDREKGTGLRQFEIGAKVLLNKHNLSRLIDRLEQNKLVCRYTSAEDGRGNQIKITAAGEKILKQMWPVYRDAIQENFGAKLSPDETAGLSHALSQVLVSHL